MKKVLMAVAALAATLFLGMGISQAALFTDNFTSDPPPQWQHQSGNWSAAGGVYNAQSPSNAPMTYTSLPYNLRDFTVDVDMNDASDGGIWLRSTYYGVGNMSGVLLVVGGLVSSFQGIYFHIFDHGYITETSAVRGGLFSEGDTLHVRVEVTGDTYTVFLNGSSTAAMSFTDSSFYSGQVGLYDFSPGWHSDHNLTFDNFALNGTPVPLPSTLLLLGNGLLGLGAVGWWRRKKS